MKHGLDEEARVDAVLSKRLEKRNISDVYFNYFVKLRFCSMKNIRNNLLLTKTRGFIPKTPQLQPHCCRVSRWCKAGIPCCCRCLQLQVVNLEAD